MDKFLSHTARWVRHVWKQEPQLSEGQWDLLLPTDFVNMLNVRAAAQHAILRELSYITTGNMQGSPCTMWCRSHSILGSCVQYSWGCILPVAPWVTRISPAAPEVPWGRAVSDCPYRQYLTLGFKRAFVLLLLFCSAYRIEFFFWTYSSHL